MAVQRWLRRTRSFFSRDMGQTMAEYAVVLAVITPLIIIAYGAFSDKIAALFDQIRGLL